MGSVNYIWTTNDLGRSDVIGVILNTYLYQAMSVSDLILFGLLGGAIGFILEFTLDAVYECFITLKHCLFGVLFGAVITIVICGFLGNWCQTTTRYDIPVENNAAVSEIENNYNIIEHNGLIYTVEEKERNDWWQI